MTPHPDLPSNIDFSEAPDVWVLRVRPPMSLALIGAAATLLSALVLGYTWTDTAGTWAAWVAASGTTALLFGTLYGWLRSDELVVRGGDARVAHFVGPWCLRAVAVPWVEVREVGTSALAGRLGAVWIRVGAEQFVVGSPLPRESAAELARLMSARLAA